MANMGSKGTVKYVETFATDTIHTAVGDGIGWLVLGDTNDTNFGRAVAAGYGLHAKAITAATNNNMVEFCGDSLMFYGQSGFSSVEVLLQLTDVTNRAFFFGFNDDSLDAGNTLPLELTTDTISATATSAIGILYDTNATNDELYCVWVDDSSVGQTSAAGSVGGKPIRMTGMAPTNSKWLFMRVELQDRGSGNGVRATFIAVDHTSKHITKTFDTTIDRDVPLCYYLAVENRSASTCTVYIKQPGWEQGMD